MSAAYSKNEPAGYINHIRNIAIVGAAGSVGEHITAHLVASGNFVVTALTREGSSSQMPQGVKVASINYDDESSIVDALRGQDALIITMKAGVQNSSLALISAAGKANVAWIMPNEYTVDIEGRPEMARETGLGPAVWGNEKKIEEMGVSSWVALSCSFWYEFSLAVSPHAYGFDIRNKKVTLFDDGTTRINASTWAQCGRAVARLFSLPILPHDDNDKGPYLSLWKNRHVYVSSFLVSQRDMLDSILRVTGDKESDWTIDSVPAEERFRDGQEAMKAGEYGRGFQTCMYTRVFYKDGCGDYSDKLDNDKLGLSEESVDEASKRAIDMVNAGYNYFAR